MAERIKPNKFRHFKMIKPTFGMLCNNIDLLVSPVIQSGGCGFFLLYIEVYAHDRFFLCDIPKCA